jgi:hypothetical protein
MKLQKTTLIGLLALILILSGTVGHILPLGIFATPITISLMTGLILYTKNGFSTISKSVLSYLFIGLNDIFIKLFAGIQGMEGLGWVHLLLFIGLVPCFIMLLTYVLQDKSSTNWIKAISVLIFILLIYVHLMLFEGLGVHIN